MSNILEGQVLINGTDIWTEYGAFLCEDRRGDMNNLKELMKPSKVKEHVAVNFTDQRGRLYSDDLHAVSDERDVQLRIAIYAADKAAWMAQYRAFITLLKTGNGGWLNVAVPGLGATFRMFYVETTDFTPLTYLWKEGKHAGKFTVKLREPVPTF